MKGFLVLVFLVAFSGQAMGQVVCLPREKLEEVLQDKYGEVVEYFGISGNNNLLMEIWLSENGSWSLMFTPTKGDSCIMATGTDWQKAKHKGIKGNVT